MTDAERNEIIERHRLGGIMLIEQHNDAQREVDDLVAELDRARQRCRNLARQRTAFCRELAALLGEDQGEVEEIQP